MKQISRISCLLFGMFILVAANSCKKDKLSNEELLTDHIWKWNKMTTTSADVDVQNMVTLANALMTGATMEFRADGTYTVTVLNNSQDGTWEMPDDNTVVTDGDQMTLIKLTGDELVLEGEQVDNDLGAYTVVMYWKK
jgi:hypothetical protein